MVRLASLAVVVAAAAALGVSEAGRISRGRGERCWLAGGLGWSLPAQDALGLPPPIAIRPISNEVTSPIAIKINMIFIYSLKPHQFITYYRSKKHAFQFYNFGRSTVV
jgi:hypothetical protein